VLEYLISPDNVRPKLLPALLENPSVSEGQIAKLAVSAMGDLIEVMLKSSRVRSLSAVLEMLRANPYLKKEEAEELRKWTAAVPETPVFEPPAEAASGSAASPAQDSAEPAPSANSASPEDEEAVSTYLKEHAEAIAAAGEKPFHAIGGVVDLLGTNYFPATQAAEVMAPDAVQAVAAAAPATGSAAAAVKLAPQKKPEGEKKRENSLQKINSLDVKGRIQLALKGSKEERGILIRDGTKVVAIAVLEAPKLSDGEVEKFASQKNVLEAVLRQIPLKRRFMKNYIVVRNLVANPRTPIDLSLGLMKNLLAADLKNISANKEVSETIRKLAMKMYKQKLEAANKK